MKSFFRVLLLLLGLLVLAGGGFYFWLHHPVQLNQEAIEFRVPPGSGLRSTLRILKKEGADFPEPLMVLAARLQNMESSIRAGTYRIESGITPQALLETLVEGKVLQIEVRLIEGWTFAAWRSKLRENSGLDHQTVNLPEAELMAMLGMPGRSPEGLFFPDTYVVDKYTSDLELFKQAARAMQIHLDREWAARQSGLPYKTPYEALIMASIVEKETGLETDRAMIAGVFVNRLRLGMRLQTDPSVIYGLGPEFSGNLRKIDLTSDTPHNTYTRAGLPPTPIAMPGLASIRAALHPEQTDALFFVARGDGGSYFSKSLDEHNAAVNRYQRRRQ